MKRVPRRNLNQSSSAISFALQCGNDNHRYIPSCHSPACFQPEFYGSLDMYILFLQQKVQHFCRPSPVHSVVYKGISEYPLFSFHEAGVIVSGFKYGVAYDFEFFLDIRLHAIDQKFAKISLHLSDCFFSCSGKDHKLSYK